MKIMEFKLYRYQRVDNVKTIPFLLSRVQAGTPYDFDDFIEEKVDLNKLLIKEPNSTYFMRLEKTSSLNNEILPGSLLIVDKDKDPRDRDIVIATVKEELYISRIRIKKNKDPFLETSNGKFAKIGSNIEIWGVVTYSIFNV